MDYNNGDYWAWGILSFQFLCLGFFLFVSDKKKKVEVVETAKEAQPLTPELSWQERLHRGLGKTRNQFWNKVEGLFSGEINQDTLDDFEELLYSSDLGTSTVSQLIEAIQERKELGKNPEELKTWLFNFLQEKMAPVQEGLKQDIFHYRPDSGLKVIMLVGVNGAGKTTTIGKLATRLTKQGAKVVVGACDTFRAAAVDQLATWCDRAQATLVRANDGADPSGVGYEALQKAQTLKADYCLLDTAGRLHTKGQLMDQLRKSKEVLKKVDPSAPHQVLLVIDAVTGQNALKQAEEFHKSLQLTGLVLTKCDGSSKAGSAVSIVEKLQVPISYIGVGESVEDLNQFHLDDYLKALLDIQKS